MNRIISLFFFLLPFLLSAQNQVDNEKTRLSELQTKIDYFINQENSDSLQYYYQQRINYFQQRDSISEYIYGYCYDFYYDVCATSSACILPFLEDAEQNLWRKPKDKVDTLAFLILYRDIGLHLMTLGKDVPRAKGLLEKAKKMLEDSRIRDTLTYDIIFKSLGNAYTILGDNERAIRHFKEGIQNPIFKNKNQTGNYLNLAISYWNKNEYQNSIQYLESGLSLPQRNARQEGKIYYKLAANYLGLKKFDRALEYGQKSLTFYDRAEDQASAKHLLANIFYEQNTIPLAAQNIEKVLDLFQNQKGRTSGKVHVSSSKILWKQGKGEPALSAANQALQAVLPDFVPNDLLDLPKKETLYPENTIFEALEVKAGVLQFLFEQNQDAKYLNASLDCYALSTEVEQLLRQQYLYESSKLSLLSDSRQRAEAALGIVAQMNASEDLKTPIDKAFQLAENSKSIVLLDALKRNSFLSSLLEKDSLVQKQRDLLIQQRFFASQFRAAGKTPKPEELDAQNKVIKKLESIQGALFEKYPSYRQSFLNEKIEAQNLLDENNVLLEFFSGEKETYLFVLEKQGTHFFAIGKSEEVNATVQNFLTFFTSQSKIDNDPKAYQRAAFQLYQKLFPLAALQKINSKKEWIIIPDGQLNFIPFEALVTTEEESLNLGKVDYLIKVHAIRYAYSATVLHQQNQRHSQSKKILAMAPVFENQERNQVPLRYSEEELASFDQALLKNKATLSAFNQSVLHSQLIHLSTHAKVDEGGQARIEFIDSTLFLDELYTLQLDADLVVLSACETGIGLLQKGEGLMSLGRGFAYAGAASLMASLWSVQDASTAWLIDDFYKNIKAGETKSEALHLAKLHYLEIAEHKQSPYYWSVLSFIGADGVLELEEEKSIWRWLLLGLLLPLGLFFVNRKIGKKG